jgi:pimeloyl-ACP methyl ester carboxylesterase
MYRHDTMRAVDRLLGIALILGATAAILEAVAERRERRRYSMPGRGVEVNGHRLHLLIDGDGRPGPTVVLEAGMVSFSSNWAWVQPEVAKVARVVAVDRAGLGWSDPGPGPRDAARSSEEVHEALRSAGIHGPYVVVGHSYGGLAVRAFAAMYPDEVAGMVLVDGSHPDQWVRFGFSSRVLGVGNKVSSVVARFGLFRILDREYRVLADGLPDRARAELMAFGRSPRALWTAGNAALAWDARTRPMINAAGGLGDRPLIVLSVTAQPRMGDKLTAMQAELPRLSSRGRQITVEGAYHEGLLADRESAKVVTSAILDVVEEVRAARPLRS